jgi:hypothetical protein
MLGPGNVIRTTKPVEPMRLELILLASEDNRMESELKVKASVE